MRYSTAAALAAMVSGALASPHGHAAHHHHHEREAVAEAQSITYSDGQCWGTFGCNAKTGAPAAPTSAPAQATSVVAQANNALANPASAVQSVASKATSAAASAVSSASGGKINVADIISKVDGMLQPKPDDTCATDDSLPNVAVIHNQSGKHAVWVCWGPAASWVNSIAPIMAVGINAGDSQTISFQNTPAGVQGSACSVLYDGVTNKLVKGQIFDTWLEWTFNEYGTVDVSREVNMNGNSISAVSPSGCTTSMDQCVFKCTGQGVTTCLTGYQVFNCSGKGANTSPTDGGCMIGTGGKIEVTIG